MSAENEFFGGDDIRPTPDPGESIGSASRSTMRRPSLGGMLRSGLRALRRFPVLLLSTYLVQVALSAGAALTMMMVLLSVFGGRPVFARAMEGDLAALMVCLQAEPRLFLSLLWIGAAAVMLYGLASWFLTAGFIAVLLDVPTRRRDALRWFGASGAANFFPFLRLALWSLLPYAAAVAAAASGLVWLDDRLKTVFVAAELGVALGLGLGPAILLHWVVAGAVDYARIDLVRHPGMSAARALLRGFRLVGRHPLALVHTLLYGTVFAGLIALYIWVAGGDAISGAVALVGARQIAGLLRYAAHVGMIAGQVELACTAMATPLGRRS